jgi:serine/threonine-protein kinase
MNQDTDRNLLFGVLALQADLLDAPRFAEACAAWAARKDVPLADLLVERGWLTAQDRAVLDHLLARKLHKHGGDVRASLAGAVTPDVRGVIASVADDAIQQSLAGLPATGANPMPQSTVAYQPTGRERYTLTRLHASGGIGQVWLAHDKDLGRDVALKELRPDRAVQPTVGARFLKEAQITGQLEHPGIVPVYELVRGEGSQPFYTMRFVRGRTLSEAIKAYHDRQTARQAGPMELRDLLTAFIGVCNAVAYAHARGVLHRDLKGRNVVLGDFGEVMVLDWGLARLLDRSEGAAPAVTLHSGEDRGETQQGQVLGTPSYMAPEQAEGLLDQLGPRTDVYGLGAILYEILTGQPPFTGVDTQEVLQRVIHEVPARPRALVAATPRGLEAVCLKAVAKKPEERYESAAALADEVRRWLADEPIKACREPWMTRARRWVGRNRTLVTSATAALLVAAISLGVATGLLADANSRVQKEKDRADQQRDVARQDFQLAREAVDNFGRKVTDDPRLKEKDLEHLRRELLRSAIEFHKKFSERHADDADLRAEMGSTYADLAFLTRNLGEREEALTIARQGLDIFQALFKEDPNNMAYAVGLGNVQRELAAGLRDLSRTEEAAAAFTQALATLEEARQRAPGERTLLAGLARTCRDHCEFLDQQLGKAEAIDAARQGIVRAEELVAAYPDDPAYGRLLADLQYYLAAQLNAQEGKATESLQICEKVIRTLEATLHKDRDSFLARSILANTHFLLAEAHARRGQRDAAVAAMRRAIDLRESLLAEHPNSSGLLQSQGRSWNNLAAIHIRFHETKAAEEAYNRALEIKRKLVARNLEVPDHRADLARTLQGLSLLVSDRARGLAYQRESATILNELTRQYPKVPQYRAALATTTHSLALWLEREGKWTEASEAHRLAIQTQLEVLKQNPGNVKQQERLVLMYRALAKYHSGQKKYADAVEAMTQAVAWQKKTVEANPKETPDRVSLAETCRDLAQYQDLAGQPEAALDTLRDAVRLCADYADARPNDAPAQAAQALARTQLGQMLRSRRRPADALAVYGETLSAIQRLAKQTRDVSLRIELAKAHDHRALCFTDLGRLPEALEEQQQALALVKELAASDPDKAEYQMMIMQATNNLGVHYFRAKQWDKASEFFRQAIDPLKGLIAKYPENAAYRLHLFNVYIHNGSAWNELGRLDDADAIYRAALEVLEKLDLGKEAIRNDVVTLLGNLDMQRKAWTARSKWGHAETAAQQYVLVAEKLAAADPVNKDHSMQRGWGYLHLGMILQRREKREAALKVLSQGASVVEPLAAMAKAMDSSRLMLRDILLTRAQVLMDLKRYEAAVPDLDRAVELAEPRSDGYRRLRAFCMARARQHTRAVGEADELAKKYPRDGRLLYDAACVHSLASTAAGKDDKLTEDERKTLGAKYAARAVVLLKDAVTMGFKDVDQIKKDADLDAVRSRDDFQILLRSLEKSDS